MSKKCCLISVHINLCQYLFMSVKGDISYHQVWVSLAITSRFENVQHSDITGGRVHLDVCWIDQPTRWTEVNVAHLSVTQLGGHAHDPRLWPCDAGQSSEPLNCDIHSHTHINRPYTSLEPRDASAPCKEPFIHISILEIQAGQVSEKPRHLRPQKQE